MQKKLQISLTHVPTTSVTCVKKMVGPNPKRSGPTSRANDVTENSGIAPLMEDGILQVIVLPNGYQIQYVECGPVC